MSTDTTAAYVDSSNDFEQCATLHDNVDETGFVAIRPATAAALPPRRNNVAPADVESAAAAALVVGGNDYRYQPSKHWSSWQLPISTLSSSSAAASDDDATKRLWLDDDEYHRVVEQYAALTPGQQRQHVNSDTFVKQCLPAHKQGGGSGGAKHQTPPPLNDNELVMYAIVNGELSMQKGKIAAQVAHGACAVTRHFERIQNSAGRATTVYHKWLQNSEPIVVVKAADEKTMERICRELLDLQIYHHRVVDEGRTQIAANSWTILMVGPLHKSRAPTSIRQDLKLL
jgi:peptidyl-tRNA hydrolase